jgi:diguanylate cyclase (GGDEF)-like protein
VRWFIPANEIGSIYQVIHWLFVRYPFFLWVSVGLIALLLFALLFLNQKRLKKFPRYGYMMSVLITIALLDLLTQEIPVSTIYIMVVGYVLLRAEKEKASIITFSFLCTYVIIQVFTAWSLQLLIELVSYSILFYWISRMSNQIRRFFAEEKRYKEKNRYLVDKVRQAQKKLHQFRNEIERTYRRDYLTGLFNFDSFQKQMVRMLIRCGSHQQCHVLCLELIDLQEVNMREGTEIGDHILAQIARHLRKNFPPPAQVTRYDGGRFAIGVMGGQLVLQRCLEIVNQVICRLRTEYPFLNYCMGTATYPREADGGMELIRLAEQRLSIEQRRVWHKEEGRRRHLEKLSAVGQLAAGLAHEIRNPLTSIRGFVQISATQSAEIKKWESIIIPEIDRINHLLNQFLNLSQSRPACFTHFNLGQLMQDVLSLLQPKSFLMGHELRYYAPHQPVVIEADAEQIKQVLINLIQNGLEALGKKGIVEVRWKEVRGQISIFIQDTGRGIHPEHLSKIFNPFFTTKGEGTGMGLSICHRIITEHGGQIYVQSELGRGTIFHIHLPLQQGLKDRLHLKDPAKLKPRADKNRPFLPPSKAKVALHQE